MTNSKSIVFVNKSSGYLMIDITNAHVPHYDNLVLLTRFLNLRETELQKKVEVRKLLAYKRSSSLKRISTWLGSCLQTLFFVFLKYRTNKVYFVSNPPLNIFTAKWLKRDFAFLVYDIYPEALVKHNIVSSQSRIFKQWEKTNQIIYIKAKRIFTLSHGMKKAMKIPDAEEHKINVVPVWTNNTFFKENDPVSLKELIVQWLKKHSKKEESLIQACHNKIDLYYNPNYQIKILKEVLQ
jgi:hypothetical protein